MTKEEAIRQRDEQRTSILVRSGCQHFLTLDLSKLPGVDVSDEVEYGPFYSYYNTRFASNLNKFYCIDNSCRYHPYPFVLEMAAPINDTDTFRLRGTNINRIGMIWAGTRHFSMFSSAVFYMSVCAQVIGKLYGRKLMEDFHKSTGWPMLHCGMGGLMSPVQVIYESALYPYGSEIEEYLQCFHEAAEYLETDFFDFLENDKPNLNPSAYSELKENVDVAVVRAELSQQRQLFEDWIQDPRIEYPHYYLPQRE